MPCQDIFCTLIRLKEFTRDESVSQIQLVHLPYCKTDPFRKGVNIVVPSAPSLLRKHIASTPPGAGPLLSKTDVKSRLRGLPDTPGFPRSYFVSTLRKAITMAGLNASSYAGHSFHRGLATWAKLSADPNDGDIKLLGRWSSDAVKLYQDIPDSRLAAIARTTLTPNPTVTSGIVSQSSWWLGDIEG